MVSVFSKRTTNVQFLCWNFYQHTPYYYTKKKELMPCTGEKISMWGNLSLHTTTTVPIFFLVTINYPLFPCISRVAPLVVVREPSRQIMMAVIWINRVRMNRRSFLLLKWNIYQHTPSWRYYHFTMSCHIYQETSLIIFCQTNFLQALLHVHIANNLFLILFEKNDSWLKPWPAQAR